MREGENRGEQPPSGQIKTHEESEDSERKTRRKYGENEIHRRCGSKMDHKRALMGNAFKMTQEFCHDIHWSDNIAHEIITAYFFFSLSLCHISSMLCTHTHRHSIICFGIIYFFLARFLVGDVDLFRVVSFSFASLRDNLERPRCDTYYESIIGIYEITKCGLCPWANKCTPFMK